MDFLNQATAQVSELFRSMTVGARITAALLLAVVVVSLGYLFNQHSTGPDDVLMKGEPVPASYLPAMEAAFAKAGLNDYRIDGTTIRIPRGKSGEYMGALADGNALPPNFSQFLEKAIDGGSAWESGETRRQRIKSAKQQQLSAIIQSMQDIQQAMVIFDEKDQPGIKRGKIQTASVNVKPIGNAPLDPDRVPALRNIVASAIAGLDPKMVSVTDLNTGRNFETLKDGQVGQTASLYQKQKAAYEREWTQKIQDALSMIPNAIVAVNVELTEETSNHSEEIEYQPKPVTVQSETNTVSESSERGASGGRPGLAAQAPPGVGGPASGGTSVAAGVGSGRTSKDTTGEIIKSLPGHTVTKIEKAGLKPDKVKAAISIPIAYLRKVWQKQNPDQEMTQEQLDTAKNEKAQEVSMLVNSLVPQVVNPQDRRRDVTITFFEDIADPIVVEEPSAIASTMGWFGKNLSTVSLSLLAVFGMVMLRSIVRANPTSPGAPEADATEQSVAAIDSPAILPFPPGENATEEEKIEHEKVLKRRLSSGPSVKDELADLVKEDPDAAATILRTWISSAG